MKVKQNSKSKKGEIPTDVGPAILIPAKKSRVSKLGEEKESPPRQVRKEPKVYLIEHGFDESPKNWDFENEDDDEDSRLLKQSFCFIIMVKFCYILKYLITWRRAEI